MYNYGKVLALAMSLGLIVGLLSTPTSVGRPVQPIDIVETTETTESTTAETTTTTTETTTSTTEITTETSTETTTSTTTEAIDIPATTIVTETVPVETSTETTTVTAVEPTESETTTTTVVTETIPELSVSDADIDLLARVTMAEAEGECEEGQRLVIDTILNRVDSGYFPNTIRGVIYQRGQFTCMTNGRINKCYVREDIRQLVIEELQSRTNYEVMYFTAGGYGRYGTPLFKVGNHYFCKL